MLLCDRMASVYCVECMDCITLRCTVKHSHAKAMYLCQYCLEIADKQNNCKSLASFSHCDN